MDGEPHKCSGHKAAYNQLQKQNRKGGPGENESTFSPQNHNYVKQKDLI